MASKKSPSAIPSEITDYLALSFKKGKTVKPTTPYRIKFRGEFITLESGKTLWRTKGHAKSAMTNHISSQIWYQKHFQCLLYAFYGSDYRHENAKNLHQTLESEGIIEYVPHTEAAFMNQK